MKVSAVPSVTAGVVNDQLPSPSVKTAVVAVPSVIEMVQFGIPASPGSIWPFVFTSRYFVPLRTAATVTGTSGAWTLNASYLHLLGSTALVGVASLQIPRM